MLFSRCPSFVHASCGLLLTVLVIGCGSQATPSPDTEEAAPLPVEVARVERGLATAAISSTASLTARDEATVVARTEGVVVKLLVEEGQYVTANEPLLQLDDHRLALEVQRAEASLEQLRSAYERTKTMYDKQLVSQETFDQARLEFENQNVAVQLAKLELAYATIRAPISGWVSARYVNTGNMVRVHDAVFDITNLADLRAELYVPERDLAKLETGQPATLTFDALPTKSFTGRVALISPVVDASTGTFKVTVAVRDPSQTIKPGMFGRVQIAYDQKDDAVLAPKSAVVEEDDAVTVFVVEDGLARHRAVRTGYASGERIEVLEGLQEGDLVVLSGQTALRDSARVEILDSPETVAP